jgi:hypothetical protein
MNELDGVFARDAAGTAAFRPAPRLTTLDVAEVLAVVEPRIRRLLDRGGRSERDHDGHAEDSGVDPWADEAPGARRPGGGVDAGAGGARAPPGHAPSSSGPRA